MPLPSNKVWPASGPSAAPKLLIPKPWGLQSRRHPANPARRGASRAVAAQKRPRWRPGPSQTRVLGRARGYPIRKRSARRSRSIGSLTRMARIGTSPSGARATGANTKRRSWLAKTTSGLDPLEPRDVQQSPAFLVSSFSFFDFVSRGTSPLTYRDRGRMGGMAMGLGWPGGGGVGLAPPLIGY